MQTTQLTTLSQKAAVLMHLIDVATEQTDAFFDFNFAKPEQVALLEYIETLSRDEQLQLAVHLLESCRNHSGSLIVSIPLSSEKPVCNWREALATTQEVSHD